MSDFPLLKKWQLLASALQEGWLGTGPVENFNVLIQSTAASGPEQDVAIVTCMGYYKSMVSLRQPLDIPYDSQTIAPQQWLGLSDNIYTRLLSDSNKEVATGTFTFGGDKYRRSNKEIGDWKIKSPRKRPCAGDGSHKYNLRTQISTPSPHVSQTSLLPPLARCPIAKWLRFVSISSTSSLSSIFATPPSSPSTLAPPTQSHPLECEIKTANKKIANLVDFLSNEVGTSCKECDEIALEAERVRELVAHYSSEVTRLQTLHDTDLGGVNLMCYVQRAMHLPLLWWFAECLCKDLECVDLPPCLEDRRDPPYTAKTLEEFYATGVAYAGLSLQIDVMLNCSLTITHVRWTYSSYSNVAPTSQEGVPHQASMGSGSQGRSLIGGPWHPHPTRLSTSENHTSRLSRRQSVSDTIDKEFSRQHVSDRKGPKPIKILLLAHPASPPQATSHKLLVPTLGQEVYPPLTADHLKLKMRLAPLGQVEGALISKIPPFPSWSNLPSRSFVPPQSMHQLKFGLDERLKQDNGRRGQSEELRNSRYDRLGRPTSDHQEIDGGRKNEIRRVAVLLSTYPNTISQTYKIALKPYRAGAVTESGCTPSPLRLFVNAALLIEHLLNLADVMQTSVFWGEKRTF
ncbi:hypothetical protein EDC04DRAFT_2613235 [Pisolithus marmoratus]|nr:hypothetical protein EDC04DRAFT_2613235 [Pisolithus marmoratus]